jgi:fructokinase
MKNLNAETIVCFGEVLWDMLPSGAKPGGAPMNVAIHLKRQGLKPFIVSSVGNDENGHKLRVFLQNSGMNLEFLQTHETLPTSQVLVHLDSEKNATYEICEPVAWDNIKFTKALESLASKTELVVFGTLAMRNETTRKTLLKFLEHSPAKRFLDVNLRPPFDKKEVVEKMLFLSDFAKLNNDELATIAGWNGKTGSEKDLVHWFSEYYNCETVCVTRGANGAALFIQDILYEHPGFKVQAEDTVGAGDSFLAGLITQLSSGNSPEKALEYACATGAFVASQPGAVPIYSKKDIEIFFS